MLCEPAALRVAVEESLWFLGLTCLREHHETSPETKSRQIKVWKAIVQQPYQAQKISPRMLELPTRGPKGASGYDKRSSLTYQAPLKLSTEGWCVVAKANSCMERAFCKRSADHSRTGKCAVDEAGTRSL